jgi:hypothetical protein
MIDINKEAEDYERLKLKENGIISNKKGAWSEGFIAGANSKYVQAKILQAQIDVLKELDIPFSGYITTQVYSRIEAFRKQLKELENG